MTLYHCYLLQRACFPGNSAILPGKASCERFAIEHVQYALTKKVDIREVNNEL